MQTFFQKSICRTLILLLVTAGSIKLATAAVVNSTISQLNVSGTTTTTVVSPANISYLDAYQHANIDITGGHISYLNLHDSSTAAVSGGGISWIHMYNNSFLSLTGLANLSWLIFDSPTARAEIHADNVRYLNGHLSGDWGNGTHFSFWALPSSFQVSNLMPSNITIFSVANSIPEPTTLMLVLFALYFVTRRRARV